MVKPTNISNDDSDKKKIKTTAKASKKKVAKSSNSKTNQINIDAAEISSDLKPDDLTDDAGNTGDAGTSNYLDLSDLDEFIEDDDTNSNKFKKSEETEEESEEIKEESEEIKEESEEIEEESEEIEEESEETEEDVEEDIDYHPDLFETESDQELLGQIAGVYQIWWNWAHFELSIISPHIDVVSPCILIMPENILNSDEMEFVYPICDYGNVLSTSKGTEMYSVGMSMCKLFYTIEKMIFILVERLKDSGVGTETEIQIVFDGHQLAQRKAFESIINLSYNVVVTNFDPGVWGERYLEIVKRLADKGYGYPSETPRDIYKNANRSALGAKR